MLTEANQEIVVLDPVLLRKLLSQGKLGFFGGRGFNISPTVGNSMHVGIDAYAGFVIAQGYHEIGGLAPDALEL
jgi:hypothetical protein